MVLNCPSKYQIMSTIFCSEDFYSTISSILGQEKINCAIAAVILEKYALSLIKDENL